MSYFYLVFFQSSQISWPRYFLISLKSYKQSIIQTSTTQNNNTKKSPSLFKIKQKKYINTVNSKFNQYCNNPDIHTYYTLRAYPPWDQLWVLGIYMHFCSLYPWSICIVGNIVSRIRFSSILRSGMHRRIFSGGGIRTVSGVVIFWCSRRRRCSGFSDDVVSLSASSFTVLSGRPWERSRHLSSVSGILLELARFTRILWGLWLSSMFLFSAFSY